MDSQLTTAPMSQDQIPMSITLRPLVIVSNRIGTCSKCGFKRWSGGKGKAKTAAENPERLKARFLDCKCRYCGLQLIKALIFLPIKLRLGAMNSQARCLVNAVTWHSKDWWDQSTGQILTSQLWVPSAVSTFGTPGVCRQQSDYLPSFAWLLRLAV